MVLHMRSGFSARSAQRWIQGGAKIGQWGALCPKDFFFRSECNSNKLNVSSYPELKYRDCLMFSIAVMLSDLLRNLTFNRSAHCTQASDQCPLGLLLLLLWTEFNETCQEARSQQPLPVCVFRTIGKTRWSPQPLIGWDIFYFSETAERKSTKLDRKQDLNVHYQFCILFRADRKNKIAASASDWLRNCRLLLWNRWTEFNETWERARSQRLIMRKPMERMLYDTMLWSPKGHALLLNKLSTFSGNKLQNGRTVNVAKVWKSACRFHIFDRRYVTI